MVQRLILAALLALGLFGCGASDEERVRSSVTRYAKAVANGDPAKACGLTVIKDKDACERALTDAILKLSDRDRDRLQAVKVKSLRVVGRVAEVKLDDDETLLGDSLQLQKQGRKWRLVLR